VGVSTAASVTGSKTMGSIPANNALVLTKVTNRGGKRGRGRWFVPWCLGATDVAEDGTIVASSGAAVATAFEQFRSALDLAGLPLVLLHSPGHSAAGSPDTVVRIAYSPVIGTQRRRLGR
jgi:hypothetical protein